MESDSDDDLFVPFLTRTKVENVVLTPRKSIRPNEEPLSPLSPQRKDTSKTKKIYEKKLSVAELLKEKEKDNIKKEKIADIVELEQKFCEREYFENNDEESLENSQLSQSQEVDFSQDALEITDEDRKKFGCDETLKNDFPDVYPGDKIFIYPVQIKELKPFLKTLTSFVMNEPVSDKELDSEEPLTLLQNILLTCIPVTLTLPDEVCITLWNIMYSVEEYGILQSALLALTNVISNNHSNVNQWLPSVGDFMTAMSYLGAGKNLIPDFAPLDMLKYRCVTTETHTDEICEIHLTRKNFSSKLNNFVSLIKLFTISIQSQPLRYSIDDLRCLVIITFQLTIEKILIMALWNIKVLIGAVLDAYSSTQWNEEMIYMSDLVSAFPMHHHNLLQLVECIPPTKRGLEFQQILAFKISHRLVTRISNESIINPVKPEAVLRVVQCIKITEETDYYELFSLFSLIAVTLHTDDITASHKKTIKSLYTKLRRIHSEIKDWRAAYMNRTKVKDVILRLISKYTFVELNLSTQCRLDGYFEKSSDPMKIETIKQTSNSETTDSETTDSETTDSDTYDEEHQIYDDVIMTAEPMVGLPNRQKIDVDVPSILEAKEQEANLTIPTIPLLRDCSRDEKISSESVFSSPKTAVDKICTTSEKT